MKHLKLLLVLAPVVGFICMTGCSKSNNNSTPAAKDSVLYSAWVTLAPTFNTTDTAYEQTITAGHITQAILDNGAVISFIKDNTGEVFTPQEIGIYPSYTVGSIFLFSRAGDYSGFPYRYVIIPGNTQTSSAANGVMSGTGRTFSTADLKAMTYAQLTKALNIPADGASK